MRFYGVVFEGTPNREYVYKAEKELPVGAVCDIEADGTTTYNNKVFIRREIPSMEMNDFRPYKIRTITRCNIIKGAPRPDDHIYKVHFNKEKGVTCVIWDDGSKTIVKCQPMDKWDEEKALALCYMKRALGNRSSFNETLKEYCHFE